MTLVANLTTMAPKGLIQGCLLLCSAPGHFHQFTSDVFDITNPTDERRHDPGLSIDTFFKFSSDSVYCLFLRKKTLRVGWEEEEGECNPFPAN